MSGRNTSRSTRQSGNGPTTYAEASSSSHQSGNTPTTAAMTSTPSRTSQIRYEIPMLEVAEGYTHWSYCMTMVLEDNDLMGIIDGTLARPNATTNPNGYADWVSRDRKARIQIAMTLHKGPLNFILQVRMAKECWDKLAARYQGKGGRCVAYLMQSFYHMPLTDTEPMEPQINKLVKANRNLETIGCGVNNETLTYIIIMALPDTLETLKAILFNKDDTTISSEVVTAQILADKERCINATGTTATVKFLELKVQCAWVVWQRTCP